MKTVVWTLTRNEGFVKLSESSAHSAYLQEVRRSELILPNGQKLDGLSTKGVAGLISRSWSSPNYFAVHLNTLSCPYFHALFVVAFVTFGETHEVAKSTQRLTKSLFVHSLYEPLTPSAL
ncbi:hypothetical protein H5410_027359 [Solanum commersonii]|uniref:Uncharacterized protein n=1 Tax=Solanum commersonii TaxID=4109 RepID=A0A9J5YYW6_SOLCO|nr:hypothetical protein H5410_027359 [Solanum commersonii]